MQFKDIIFIVFKLFQLGSDMRNLQESTVSGVSLGFIEFSNGNLAVLRNNNNLCVFSSKFSTRRNFEKIYIFSFQKNQIFQ